jgi:hypothetical protein
MKNTSEHLEKELGTSRKLKLLQLLNAPSPLFAR